MMKSILFLGIISCGLGLSWGAQERPKRRATEIEDQLKTIEQDWKRVISDAQTARLQDQKGLKEFRFYLDSLTQKQVELPDLQKQRLSELFEKYLGVSILQEGIDGRQARSYAEWAIQRLQELEQSHQHPNPKNNPHLAVLLQNKKLAIDSLRKVLDVAAGKRNSLQKKMVGKKPTLFNRTPASSESPH